MRLKCNQLAKWSCGSERILMELAIDAFDIFGWICWQLLRMFFARCTILFHRCEWSVNLVRLTSFPLKYVQTHVVSMSRFSIILSFVETICSSVSIITSATTNTYLSQMESNRIESNWMVSFIRTLRLAQQQYNLCIRAYACAEVECELVCAFEIDTAIVRSVFDGFVKRSHQQQMTQFDKVHRNWTMLFSLLVVAFNIGWLLWGCCRQRTTTTFELFFFLQHSIRFEFSFLCVFL